MTKFTFLPFLLSATLLLVSCNKAAAPEASSNLAGTDTTTAPTNFGSGSSAQLESKATGTAPVIVSLAAESITTSSASLRLKLNKVGTSQAEYGVSESKTKLTPKVNTLKTEHLIPISGLAADTLYYYRIQSFASGGRSVLSSIQSFRTAKVVVVTPPPVVVVPPVTSPAGAVVLNMANVALESGYAYKISIDESIPGDTSASPQISKLRLFENEVEIGPAHEVHAEIAANGKGSFSHWGTRLYFSSSDNTNPKTNGRKYSYLLNGVSTVPPVVQPPVVQPPVVTPPTASAIYGLMGYGTQGGSSVTGGAGGATVTVKTVAELVAAVKGSTPTIIKVSGVLNGNDGYLQIGSNKSIIGLPGAEIRALGFYMFGTSNVIIQNLKMWDGNPSVANDVGYSIIAIKENAHHVWIDHVEMYPSNNNNNGHTMMGISKGAQYVTLSWSSLNNKYTGLLIGASETDLGPHMVTIHHCLFDNMLERQPKISGGYVHAFNNYFRNAKTEGHTPVGITAVNGATVRAENNYFENFAGYAITTEYNYPSETYGFISGLETNYKDSKGQFHITTPASNWMPPYSYSNYLTPVKDVPATVLSGVGAILK